MSKKLLSKVLVLLLVFLTSTMLPKANAQNTTPYFTYSPITPRVGDIVTFNAAEFEAQWLEKNGTLIWHFGDGESSTGAIVNHTYTSPGTYGAGVLAADETGDGPMSEHEVVVRDQTPVTVNIALSERIIKTGQKVTITGNLIYKGSSVKNEWITLSSTTYPFNQWKEIATVKTDELGRYSYDWKAFYGYYHIKAIWTGNSTYPESSVSVVLIVETFGELINEFSSNSTITGMNYNGTSRILKFSAEGPSGTTGYTKIHIREDEKFDPDKVNVLFDGQPIEYKITSPNQIWILEFTYTHSIHNIEVNFADSPQTTLPSTIEIVVIVVLVVVALGLAVNLAKKRRS